MKICILGFVIMDEILLRDLRRLLRKKLGKYTLVILFQLKFILYSVANQSRETEVSFKTKNTMKKGGKKTKTYSPRSIGLRPRWFTLSTMLTLLCQLLWLSFLMRVAGWYGTVSLKSNRCRVSAGGCLPFKQL